MPRSDSTTLYDEIQKLRDEDASWLDFCKMGIQLMQYVCDERDENVYAFDDRGQKLVDRVLHQQSGDDCLQLCRMRPQAFRQLVYHLREHYGFGDSRYISAEVRLAFTMFILGHSVGMRLAHIFFGFSTATIHQHFHQVLEMLRHFSDEMIRPHPNYLMGEGAHAPVDPRHEAFRDCIGAIDGTHIPAVPPSVGSERYRNRNGELTQNVLAVVDFNMCFTFVGAGWEWSTHDSRMLHGAMETPSSTFPFPTGDKYYVVDSGFANRRGFLGPYRGQNKYHMQEFHRATSSQARQPRNREELFNYVHSSCRNVVERSFGVLKKRFIILQRMPDYEIRSQVSIVLATIAIHNYLRQVDRHDPGFLAAIRPDYLPREPDVYVRERQQNMQPLSVRARHEWEMFRENITNELCQS